MAGRVRQEIDQVALNCFLRDYVPEIATPIELKQVSDHRQKNLAR